MTMSVNNVIFFGISVQIHLKRRHNLHTEISAFAQLTYFIHEAVCMVRTA